MAAFTVLDGRDPLVVVDLQPGEAIIAESNSMVMTDGAVEVEGKMQGGLLSSVARSLFSDESLFQQVLRAAKDKPGQVFLAPQLPGDMKVLEVGSATQFFLNSGCFVASEEGVSLGQQLNSSVLGAFFGGTGGIVVMRTEGVGALCVSAFGQILEIDVSPGSDVVVDNGHVVAWQTTLDYRVTQASKKKGMVGRMLSSAMSGEFLVTRFSGQGKLFIASRNISAFEDYIKALAIQKR